MDHIDYLRIYDIQKQASVELWFNQCAGWEIEKKRWKLVKVVLISPFVWTNLYLLHPYMLYATFGWNKSSGSVK